MNRKPFGCGVLVGIVLTVVVALSLVLFSAYRAVKTKPRAPDAMYAQCPKDGDERATALLAPIRAKHRVPAICAAILTSTGVEAVGVVGVRKIGGSAPATVADQWHLGSDTKAMTAALAGKLVEEDKLLWSTSLAEVFPELALSMRPEWKEVTLLHLLSHRAGLPENLDWRALSKHGSLQEQRYSAVKQASAQKPGSKAGSQYNYSNLGYVIVGAIIERVTSNSWEEVLQAKLCAPLNMTTVGFGGTGTAGQTDQPWGHNADGTPAPTNGIEMDNPLVLAPAGCVHCSMADWSRFVMDQLRGARGKPGLLKPETYKTIQSPPFGGDYALGWSVQQREWGGGTVLAHGGCNTLNYANAWIAPQRDFAVLACVNQGGDHGFKASDEAIGAMINLHLKK